MHARTRRRGVIGQGSLCLLLLAALAAAADARQATNGGFESGAIPSGLSQITNASGWSNANLATSDYLRAGGSGGAGVPTNFFGSIPAHGGNAYAGIITYASNPGFPGYLYREYLQGPLATPLAANVTYDVEFFAARANGPEEVLACNRLGVAFTPGALAQGDAFNLSSVTPAYENPSVIVNPNGWTRIHFTYTPTTSGLQNLVLGNFRNNAGTLVYSLGSSSSAVSRAYYYIDDVSVTECSHVTNGGFELGLVPNDLAEIAFATSWSNASMGTCDYFAVGGTNGAGVPANFFGSILPHGGNAYAGLIACALNSSSTGYVYREYMQCPLSAPLVVGDTYQVEFWTSRGSGGEQVLACNDLGVAFTTASVFQANTNPLAVIPAYEHPAVITDSTSWHRIVFYYTPTSPNLQNVIIGNFRDNAGTTTQSLGTSPSQLSRAYYYIDDLRITCYEQRFKTP